MAESLREKELLSRITDLELQIKKLMKITEKVNSANQRKVKKIQNNSSN